MIAPEGRPPHDGKPKHGQKQQAQGATTGGQRAIIVGPRVARSRRQIPGGVGSGSDPPRTTTGAVTGAKG